MTKRNARPRVVQGPDGQYTLDLRPLGGGRAKLGSDASEAVERAIVLWAEARGLEPPQLTIDRVPLSWVSERYQAGDRFARLAPGTQRSVREHSRALLASLGDLDVNAADWSIVWARALRRWEEDGIHGNTVNKRAWLLGRMLRFAHAPAHNGGARGRVRAVPELATYDKPKASQRGRWLTRPEFARLLTALEPHRRTWCAVAAWTGQRYHDVCTMSGDHVRPDGTWLRRSHKTRIPDEWLVLPAELRAYLPAQAGHGPIAGRWGNSRRDLHAAAKRAGIAPLSVHDFRRTCATWLLEAGAGRDTARLWLGLEPDSRLLEQVYGRRGPAQARRTAAEISRALGKYSGERRALGVVPG